MEQNNFGLSPAQVQQLLSSPAARELMQMMKKAAPGAMDAALAGAKKGDAAAVQSSLAAFLSDPKAKELLRQMQEGSHGRDGR